MVTANEFKRGKFCSMNLISFYDQVAHVVDQWKSVDVMLLYFSKVFKTVFQSILLHKMLSV